MFTVDYLRQLLELNAANPGTFCGKWLNSGDEMSCRSPIDLTPLGSVRITTPDEYEETVRAAADCFERWRMYPAPKRGEVVRRMNEKIRERKRELGALISYETGKIFAEGEGEVQEVIDIADFAVGLSRQLYGLTMHSERPFHRMYEQWHPLGPVGVITAFNFPAAVWAWNAMIAAVCGDPVIWKPSELAPLTAIALTKLCQEVAADAGFPALFSLVNGGADLGERLAADARIPLISATGSSRMGRHVGEIVARRFGKVLLELGGNNAIIVLADADLDLALRAILFGAVGTAGQRCTSTRRVIVERSAALELAERLAAAYAQVPIGNPLEPTTLMGPLIGERAVGTYSEAIRRAEREGATVLYGGRVLEGMPSPFYVEPTIVRAPQGLSLLKEETFAPILYLIEVDGLDEAIRLHNDVPQGLSSAIFTRSIRSAELFLSARGSDCGIANVNIGTSGAEIGGAFGGEKETGGGREAGSDSWKAYMRRQTSTINWSDELPLAQGIRFAV